MTRQVRSQQTGLAPATFLPPFTAVAPLGRFLPRRPDDSTTAAGAPPPCTFLGGCYEAADMARGVWRRPVPECNPNRRNTK